ncbi:phosphate transport system protein PhoU [Methylococcus capsulatus str. Bath]|uniref:Phosphate-specific transport system accessory protein PhoU n=1 Tax=Methylococcus capsulatus (strain ATCC 33009 / NCIMB 11132 / Bath) TaxID=243233 RepID=Q609Z7_METCA|nr:phosphate signaling complex protein PhoU [Methylococcus capsulatus]AAU92652.1 phosphate transport system protein PhoU [Methylococcus capsulatus str. Bath]
MNQVTEGHSIRRYDGELRELHYKVLEMGTLVLTQVKEAVRSLKTGDVSLAAEIIEEDDQVDDLEVEADTEVVAQFARRCPKGSDLRLVMALSKAITDLERVGDEAVKIASCVERLYAVPADYPAEVPRNQVLVLADLVVKRFESALRIVDSWEAEQAQQFIASQREVSERFQQTLGGLMDNGGSDAGGANRAVNLVLVLKALERIACHAENLAEYVIYQAMGLVIRHHAV